MDSAVPDAPCPSSRCRPAGCDGAERGLTAALRLLAFEDLERGRLRHVCRCWRPPWQPRCTHQRAGEQDAAAAPERKPRIEAVERAEYGGAKGHPAELVEATDT